MKNVILFVDDDPNLLSAVSRGLRGRYDVQTAVGPEDGLAAVRERGAHHSFAVVVADMRMPGKNGVDFLMDVAEIAPFSVRMMLTGQADQQTAIDAVNKGNIFRFLTKPCSSELLALALDAGVEQFKLVTAEKDLLAKTLSGGVKLMTDVLALAKPKAFGRASRVRRMVQRIAAADGTPTTWQLEIATMLSQVGCVTLPEAVLERVCQGKPLTAKEAGLFAAHPRIGAELVANIPRLQDVAHIIAYQEKRFDGLGPPADGKQGEEIPWGARVLKLALDFDALREAGHTEQQAAQELRRREGWYDPRLVARLIASLNVELSYEARNVTIATLADGMILDEHIMSCEGDVLITRGNEITSTSRQRLENYVRLVRPIKEPIRVLVPLAVGPIVALNPASVPQTPMTIA